MDLLRARAWQGASLIKVKVRQLYGAPSYLAPGGAYFLYDALGQICEIIVLRRRQKRSFTQKKALTKF